MRKELEQARSESWVVTLQRSAFEDEGEMGYVVAIGEELLLLLVISSEIRFNGFSTVRVDDVTELDSPHDHAEFVAEALRRRGSDLPEAPPVSLSSMQEALRSIARVSPLVTLHREDEDNSICHIGKIARVDDENISLLEIDPDAEWDDEATLYRIDEITRVDFGGSYEEALVLVGGPGPDTPHLRRVQ